MIKPFNSSFFCSSLYIHVYFKDCVIRPHRVLIYRYFAWMHIFRFYLWRGLDIQSYIRVILLEPTLTWKHAELKKKLSFFFKLSWIMHGLFVYQSYSLSQCFVLRPIFFPHLFKLSHSWWCTLTKFERTALL